MISPSISRARVKGEGSETSERLGKPSETILVSGVAGLGARERPDGGCPAAGWVSAIELLPRSVVQRQA
jgi:hypothetical protein